MNMYIVACTVSMTVYEIRQFSGVQLQQLTPSIINKNSTPILIINIGAVSCAKKNCASSSCPFLPEFQGIALSAERNAHPVLLLKSPWLEQRGQFARFRHGIVT